MARLFLIYAALIAVLAIAGSLIWRFHWWTIPLAAIAVAVIGAIVIVVMIGMDAKDGRNPFE